MRGKEEELEAFGNAIQDKESNEAKKDKNRDAFYLGLGTLRNLTERMFGRENSVWNETMAQEAYDEYWKPRRSSTIT